MKVQILTELPVPPRTTKVEGVQNIIQTNGMKGLQIQLRGDGTVDLYTFQEGAWRKHPQGVGVVDDGVYTRAVISSTQSFAALKADGEVPEETEGYISCGNFS